MENRNPIADVSDSIPPDYKLCGFLRAVLRIKVNPNDDLADALPLGSFCRIAGDAHYDVHFVTDNGVVLAPINSPDPDGSGDATAVPSTSKNKYTKKKKMEKKKKKKSNSMEVIVDTPSTSKKNNKWSRIGMVNGSLSVVHQLHALVAHKCLSIIARVVCVAAENGEARAVLLIDVYLPVALWSGWRFPKSASAAAALFRHVSCDWKARGSILEYAKLGDEDYCSIWNLSDCHALGCKHHCSAPDPSKKKLFELHEIFKSLPSIVKKVDLDTSRINAADPSRPGISLVADDILVNILSSLDPIDLVRVSATCHHLRHLTASIMPCMKLKLFPHQQAAVDWMLQRERDVRPLPHPLYMDFVTEDGFVFYLNVVSGEVVTDVAPKVNDFHGGMFCDEPGLGKTITLLSLILKTQGTLAEPPDGVEVIWCSHNGDQKCGYYELRSDNDAGVLPANRVMGQKARRGMFSPDKLMPKRSLQSSLPLRSIFVDSAKCVTDPEIKLLPVTFSTPPTCATRCTRSWSHVKRNLLLAYEESALSPEEKNPNKSFKKRKHVSNGQSENKTKKQHSQSHELSSTQKKLKKFNVDNLEHDETWVQCDACRRWRRVDDASVMDTSGAWFCSMNTDPLFQTCSAPEESWDSKQPVTYLPGFHTKGTPGGMEENVSFFINVLKDHYTFIDSVTKKALTWLAKLSAERLSEMEAAGLVYTVVDIGVPHPYNRIFQAFGLVKRVEKGFTRWLYPRALVNLVFDLDALRIALCRPLNSFRLYLSRATLVVVPSNLVDHWRTQIEKHVRPGQLRVFAWTDRRKPSVHNLAWDYDVVITTFNRLSAEWSPQKKRALMQVHWLRIVLDEGHTLGSSLSLTNKLQMAVSLKATNRWILTGTPTPNIPNSQLSHLQPMLKFLQEEAYGQNQKSWETGIIRPFEAEMEEGRSRLLQLLHRCMISARKKDLLAIPPCIKKVMFLNFTQDHARSYNELVETVRRNILMADWNDPSHVESLLNPKQWKFRSATIRNVRLSCCVAGHVSVTDASQDIQETMDILVGNGLDPSSEEYAFIKYNLQFGGNCMRCKVWCRLPVITPCKHLLCLDCVSLDSEKCTFPGCGNLYEMQSPEILTRPENPNPKWPVPQDLIELQPSYKQDDWNPDWQSTSSSKVTYLVHRLREIQEANRLLVQTIEDEGANSVNDIRLPFLRSNISMTLHGPESDICQVLPEKVIIFSQFLEHIHVIEQQLTIAGIEFASMYSPMHSANKIKSLATFQHDANCLALLMDGSAALGLDLSFVSRVYVMEPIWDKSMEEQVISRAHRMGATRPIFVETLAMSGTIEDQMLKFLQDPDEFRSLLKEVHDKQGRDGSRLHRTVHDFAENNYLARLSFVRTSCSET
nr:F-box protein At3g54460 isoform X1 [Ipomoea batatas]